jgi:hypothetical protein
VGPLSRSLLGVKWTRLFAAHLSAFDPKRTLAVYSGDGFGTGFGAYQGTRLSR